MDCGSLTSPGRVDHSRKAVLVTLWPGSRSPTVTWNWTMASVRSGPVKSGKVAQVTVSAGAADSSVTPPAGPLTMLSDPGTQANPTGRAAGPAAPAATARGR